MKTTYNNKTFEYDCVKEKKDDVIMCSFCGKNIIRGWKLFLPTFRYYNKFCCESESCKDYHTKDVYRYAQLFRTPCQQIEIARFSIKLK